ncbi:hypothetical protein [Paramaledivibacter caminithermalis]|uniref:Uncharacterized protein n=1 Tax=Paramaledivibacter caminithermalis (strain DSM 15212 / CIP 107654 / DViRD3) TaxID=1121301 RepID=A0A1M6REV8_PARC5|nr:hypothetical protein [Paramaledivibacter caminithermalis]SHK30897.1 hypothetical protein SAMN02745912_02941 [Paramaledivibacter caminithermalis DSM 15212]
MKHKLLVILITLLIMCLIFQQVHILQLKKQLGLQVQRRIDQLYRAVHFAKSSISNKTKLEINDLHKLKWIFNEQDIKIECIYSSVLSIEEDLDELYEQLKNNKLIVSKEHLLIKLSKLEKALNIVKEDCKDIPINYYYLKYKNNNKTIKKIEEIQINN